LDDRKRPGLSRLNDVRSGGAFHITGSQNNGTGFITLNFGAGATLNNSGLIDFNVREVDSNNLIFTNLPGGT